MCGGFICEMYRVQVSLKNVHRCNTKKKCMSNHINFIKTITKKTKTKQTKKSKNRLMVELHLLIQLLLNKK